MNESDLSDRFQEALEKRDHGDVIGAVALLLELTRTYPSRAAVWGTLGGIYFSVEDWANAAEAFKRATSLSPRSELSSVSLFHSLLRLGRRVEASSEATRFLREVPDSLEYRRLERELKEGGYSMLALEDASS